jgi:hypothetical protein
MPTSYLKLPYTEVVLRPGALQPLVLAAGSVGFTLDIGLNYYRGLPLSAVEEFELTVDGERIPDHLLLFEYDRKLFMPNQLSAAAWEFWSIKKPLRVRAFNGGLADGEHSVDVRLILRSVYMQFAPGVWGLIDGSASQTLELGMTA